MGSETRAAQVAKLRFGRAKKQWKPPYEMAQCIALMQWVNLQLVVMPDLQLLVHIPNEGKRTKFYGMMLKRMGLKSGVWDYILPVPRVIDSNPYPGLWLEMKSPGEELSKEQDWWGRMMSDQGYMLCVAYSWVTAKEAICQYLAGGIHPACRLRH
jgi:hypothetical protein